MWRVSEDDLANYLKPVDNETQERVAAGTLGLAERAAPLFPRPPTTLAARPARARRSELAVEVMKHLGDDGIASQCPPRHLAA